MAAAEFHSRWLSPACRVSRFGSGSTIRAVGVADQKPIGPKLVEQRFDAGPIDGPEPRRLSRQQRHPRHLDVLGNDPLPQWIS